MNNPNLNPISQTNSRRDLALIYTAAWLRSFGIGLLGVFSACSCTVADFPPLRLAVFWPPALPDRLRGRCSLLSARTPLAGDERCAFSRFSPLSAPVPLSFILLCRF